jgi:hypothetical protein
MELEMKNERIAKVTTIALAAMAGVRMIATVRHGVAVSLPSLIHRLWADWDFRHGLIADLESRWKFWLPFGLIFLAVLAALWAALRRFGR